MRTLLIAALFAPTVALAGAYPFTSVHVVDATSSESPTALIWTDLDGDGDLDALASIEGLGGPGLGHVFWFENRQKGKRFIKRSIDDMLRYPVAVHAVDMDGDKDLDVVAVGKPGLNDKPLVKGGVYWYENVAGAKVWKSHTVDDSDDAASAGVASGDVDGDGDLDLVGLSYGKILWYENKDGKGGAWEAAASVAKAGQEKVIIMLKYDADEHIDFVTGGTRDSALSWWKGEGNGVFKRNVLVQKKAVNSLILADVDGDKDMDLVAGLDGGVYFNINGGGGDWTLDEVWTKNTQPLQANVIDFDGDKDMDLIVRSRDSGISLSLIERDGDAYKKVTQIERTEDLAFWLHVVDVDGDGDPDLSMDYKRGFKSQWFENRSKKRKK